MRILIAEDDRVSRNVLERVLRKWGYEVVVTCDGEAAWEVLREGDAPRLAILDWMMPGLDGPDVCRRVRELDMPDPPYIILLTARGGKDDIVTGLEAGANDYVGKPFDRDELRARVDVGRRFAELTARLLDTQRILERQARTDALTGVMNRRAVLERLREEVARAHRQETTLGVGMIDIDRFKRINDTYGHAAGDVVLREVAARSRSAMRPYDGFGRVGGEEFLAIMPHSGDEEVRGVLERVRVAVSAAPVEAQGNVVPVTVSVGGAVNTHRRASAADASTAAGSASAGDPVDDAPVDELISAADDALYKAKGSGRDQVVMAAQPALSR